MPSSARMARAGADGLDVIWLETDPRRFSTSGDGLPDGWKVQYGLDPFDDGVIGDYNLNTGKVITNTNNGPNGNPERATASPTSRSTSMATIRGSRAPRVRRRAGRHQHRPVPANAMTVGGVTNDKEFAGWTGEAT